MQKTMEPVAWSFEAESCALVPVSHNLGGGIGLGPNDRRVFAKRAGEELMAKLALTKFLSGEQPVHLIAIGATEAYSANRNGDGFKEATCRKYHPTFVKHARFFRDHQTQKRDRNYGLVKLSHYNDRMRRIELVPALNETKLAADRNGGLVADLELQKIAAGEDLGVSMGCSVPYDQCSHCGNKAKNRNEYCDESMCKAGGLKHNMGRLQADGSILHADNPDPTFNDISHITRSRQADRTAYVMGVLQKAASTGHLIGGAELAELVYSQSTQRETRWTKLATELANIEQTAVLHPELLLGLASRESLPPLGVSDVQKLAMVTAALSDRCVVLPVDAFVSLIAGRELQNAGHLKQAVVGLFDRLEPTDYNPYEYHGAISSQCLSWAAKTASEYSLSSSAIAKRSGLRAVQGGTATLLPLTKLAAISGETDELVQQYGLYVLASLNRMCERNLNHPLTAVAAILQNRTC